MAVEPSAMPERLPTLAPSGTTRVCPSDSVKATVRSSVSTDSIVARWVAGWVEKLSGRSFDTLHIVGGGSQNRMLCQMAADCLQKRVTAGPVEATALGNVAMQAVATGHAPSLAAMRNAIRRTAAVETYTPHTSADWDAAYRRFLALTGGGDHHLFEDFLRGLLCLGGLTRDGGRNGCGDGKAEQTRPLGGVGVHR